MKSIFFLIIFFFFNIFSCYSNSNLNIISREEWWAEDIYLDINSTIWKNILKEETSKVSKNELWRIKEFIEIINKNFNSNYSRSEKKYYYEWIELAWPIQKSLDIKSIIIHHTDYAVWNSTDTIKVIYKDHAIYNKWWDIWYNFLIWKNWEIFEWRLWWADTVWAHSKRNNINSLWIALIWDYQTKWISKNQLKSLEKLINNLIDKYNIDVTKKVTYLNNCLESSCTNLLKFSTDYAIVWHRDTTHTKCPWDELYNQIIKLRKKIIKEQEMYKKFDIIWEKRIKLVLKKLEWETYKNSTANNLKNIINTYLTKK